MKTRLLLSIVSVCAATSAMAADPKPFERSETSQVTASVESVDPATRAIVLKGNEGIRVAMVAGPDVRNLDQIKPGDKVVAVYHQALAAEVKPRGTATSPPTAADHVERAKPGEKPSGAAGISVATTVQIESVDKSFNTVSFRRSDGIVRTVAVEDPEAKRFLQTLKPGDPVEIVYTEALAVSVKPAKP
jgi:Cu/Ag efflux protein CusF